MTTSHGQAVQNADSSIDEQEASNWPSDLPILFSTLDLDDDFFFFFFCQSNSTRFLQGTPAASSTVFLTCPAKFVPVLFRLFVNTKLQLSNACFSGLSSASG